VVEDRAAPQGAALFLSGADGRPARQPLANDDDGVDDPHEVSPNVGQRVFHRRRRRRDHPPHAARRGAMEIVAIDFASAVTARAVVRCAIGTKHFTDFLALIQLDGRWQIISKVFHYEEEG
jgi:Putative lumazine-binding